MEAENMLLVFDNCLAFQIISKICLPKIFTIMKIIYVK